MATWFRKPNGTRNHTANGQSVKGLGHSDISLAALARIADAWSLDIYFRICSEYQKNPYSGGLKFAESTANTFNPAAATVLPD